MLGHHTSQRYDAELEKIRSRVLEMGGLVEEQVNNSIKALIEHDGVLAKQVVKNDEAINTMEVEIDDECTKIIARRQPAASDLRLIVVVLKAITDLERMGDEAEAIGQYAKKLAKKDRVSASMHTDLAHLSKLVSDILRDTLDAFARLDVEQAIRIVSEDAQINHEIDSLQRLLVTYMMEDSRNIKSALRTTWCARSLERISDHCQNICEYIIFLVQGKDVRHTSLEHIRAAYYPADAEESV